MIFMGLEVPAFSKNEIELYTICITIIYKWDWAWFDTQRKEMEFMLGLHIFYDSYISY
jgi:hypothetical protein